MESRTPATNFRLRDGQYRDGRNLSARFRLHQRFGTGRYPFNRWVFDRFALPGDARVLEVGCGFGAFWKGNSDRIPAGWRVALSDFSFGMLAEACSNLSSVRAFAFQQLDASAIPYRDRTLDAVIANHMLYHVPDLALTLREVRRVLKPGGVLYATTVGQGHMRELDEIADRFVGIAPMVNVARRFGLTSGLAPLREVFEDVRVEVLGSELRVTEAEPVIDYVRSMSSTGGAADERFDAMKHFVEHEIQSRGALTIQTESGLFVARA
jgi:SAM-dependent methyltransferase